MEAVMIRILVSILCLFTIPALADDKTRPKATPADELLCAAQAEAKTDRKAIFLAFGSPTCGWCKYLDKFHDNPTVEKILRKHLVFVKIDIVDNPGGEAQYKKYATKGGGVPFWVILSAKGEVLADSYEDGKKNVGFPYEPNELAHYEKVMRSAIPKLTDEDMATLMTQLKELGPKKKSATKD
jgi:thiol-disulfide isomerase/thioredoxin